MPVTSKKPDTWMPIYIGDYMRDTMHLTTEEHGSYLLILFHGWMNGGRVPADDSRLAAITRLSPERWECVKHTVKHFFKHEGRWLTQKRLSEELDKAQNLQAVFHERAAVAAKKRWASDASSNASSNASGTRQAMLEPMLGDAPSPSPLPVVPIPSPAQRNNPAEKRPGAVASHPAPKSPNNAKPAFTDPMDVVRKILPAALVRGASMARVSVYTMAKIAASDGHSPVNLLAWCYVASRDVRAGDAGKREKIESPDAWYTALATGSTSPPDADYDEAKKVLRVERDSAEIPERERKLLADIVAKMGAGNG